MKILLPSTYFGNLAYYRLLFEADEVVVETKEHFQKQSFRNRCSILGANGVQNLIVPINRKQKKDPLDQLEISFAQKWPSEHYRSLVSAYKVSPYFEHYEHLIEDLLLKFRPSSLLEWNIKTMQIAFKCLQEEVDYQLTSEFETEVANDYRDRFKPKDTFQTNFKHQEYIQVFGDKFGFQQNLSILDLIFNEGPNAINILMKK